MAKRHMNFTNFSEDPTSSFDAKYVARGRTRSSGISQGDKTSQSPTKRASRLSGILSPTTPKFDPQEQQGDGHVQHEQCYQVSRYGSIATRMWVSII